MLAFATALLWFPEIIEKKLSFAGENKFEGFGNLEDELVDLKDPLEQSGPATYKDNGKSTDEAASTWMCF